MRANILIAAGASVFISSTVLASESPPDLLHFNATTVGQELATSAIKIANNILGSHSEYQLTGSWWPAGHANFSGKKVVTVYLIEKTPGKTLFNIMVPYDCDCVFVQPDVVKEKLAAYTVESETMMAVDRSKALAFMLLHEIGHIKHGDPGSFDDIKIRGNFNFDETEQKKRESLADQFAADAIVAGANGKDSVPGFLSAMDLELAISNISWNLSKIRTLDNFGADALCATYVFSDDGDTHPNFELRILHVNDLIAQTKESAELVKSFERCRKAPTSALIYQAP